jgi:hypothetical protein
MLGAQIINYRRLEMAGTFPHLVKVVGAPFVIPTYHRKLPRTEASKLCCSAKGSFFSARSYGGCGNRGLHNCRAVDKYNAHFYWSTELEF